MGYLAEMQRKLLEQLMGPEAMGVIQADLKFWDAKVCRNFSCGVCPHELFTNTKMDLGACPHMHSVKLKEQFEAAFTKANAPGADQSAQELPLDRLNSMRAEYERNILEFVGECDRRIAAAHRRLDSAPEENAKTTSLMRDIGEIQTAYDEAMAEVERLGEAGKVDESMAELQKAEALKNEKQEKENELQSLNEQASSSGQSKLRVCDICGAYLSILDSDRRLADHFGGKLRTMIQEWRTRPPEQIPRIMQPQSAPPNGGPPPIANGHGNDRYAGGPPPSDRGYGDRGGSRRDDRDSRDSRDRGGYDDRRSSRYDDRRDDRDRGGDRGGYRDREDDRRSSRPYHDRDADAGHAKRTRYD